jgi:hypothetical protein
MLLLLLEVAVGVTALAPRLRSFIEAGLLAAVVLAATVNVDRQEDR